MKSASPANLSELFQSNQGSRSPWFLFWLLAGIAILAVIIAWWMKRGEVDEAPPATSGDTPAVEPVVAQAVASAHVAEEPATEETAPSEESEQPAEEEPTEVETDEPEAEAPAEEAPVEESVEVEEAETPAEPGAPVKPDDLTKVEGIGPKISSILQGQGISTYSQLANTDVEKLRQIMKDAKLRIAHPDTWPEQATLAAAGDWEGLDKLQDELKGGRRAG